MSLSPEQLLNDVIRRAEELAGPDAKKGGAVKDGWHSFCCPAHREKNPSARVKIGQKGLLFKCFAGCTKEAIVEALGYANFSEVFYDHGKPRAPEPPLRLSDLAQAKRLPVEFLAELGFVEEERGLRIRYRRPGDAPDARARNRWKLKAKAGSCWDPADEKGEIVPYGIWRALDAAKPLHLVEGETDCATLWFNGLQALGIPGATMGGKLKREHLRDAEGNPVADIVLAVEPDAGGEAFRAGLRERLSRAVMDWGGRLWMIRAPGGAKDASEAWLKAGAERAAFADAWDEAWRERLPLNKAAREARDAAAATGLPSAPPAETPGDPNMEPEEAASLFLEALLGGAGTVPAQACTGGAPQGIGGAGAWAHRGLVRWRDQFYMWGGRGYAPVPAGRFEEIVNAWLEKSGHGHRAVQYVNNMVLNLRSKCSIDYAIQPPCLLPSGKPAGNVLPLANGRLDVLRLVRDGKYAEDILAPSSPELFTLAPLPFAYDPAAGCPRWEAFLEEILPDVDSRDTLAEVFGYCLLEGQSFQRLFILTGEGANGKSVVCEVLRELVGRANCAAVPLETLAEPHATEPLVGKRVNLAPEWGHIPAQAEGVLKAIVGGDEVLVNPKGRSAYQARIDARFVVTTNQPPRINDRSQGIWRRLLVLPFPVVIAPERRRPIDEILEGFRPELPGILLWAVSGLHNLRLRGRFEDTAATRAVLDDYRLASNPAATFLEENVVIDPAGEVVRQELYSIYAAWCGDTGHKALALSSFGQEVARFVRAAGGQVGECQTRIEGKRMRCWTGLRVVQG